MTKILTMEEGHVDWAEIQQTQIQQMGLENYLVNQTS
jgi:bacterioferritin (cytochrome b1)